MAAFTVITPSSHPEFFATPPADLATGELRRETTRDICVICRDNLLEDEDLIHHKTDRAVLHVFHRNCLTGWMKEEVTCPLCRIRITSINGIEVAAARARAAVRNAEAADAARTEAEVVRAATTAMAAAWVAAAWASARAEAPTTVRAAAWAATVATVGTTVLAAWAEARADLRNIEAAPTMAAWAEAEIAAAAHRRRTITCCILGVFAVTIATASRFVN